MTGRIVVGVDGSKSSTNALRWAVSEARRTGRRLDLLTAWEPMHAYAAVPPLGAPALPGPAVVGAEALQAAAAQAREVALEAVRTAGLPDSSVAYDLRQVEGDAATVLVEASEGADMVAVGPCGHGALVGLVLGSVADHLTRHALCPVVVVRGDVS